jgi:hypothetical protein
VPLASNGSGGPRGIGPGVRVEGCYQSMLQRAKQRHEQPDPRATVGLPEPPKPKHRKPTGRYAALLAGEPVVVPVWFALPGNTFRGVRDQIPWAGPGSAVLVTADDMVRPARRRDVLAG